MWQQSNLWPKDDDPKIDLTIACSLVAICMNFCPSSTELTSISTNEGKQKQTNAHGPGKHVPGIFQHHCAYKYLELRLAPNPNQS